MKTKAYYQYKKKQSDDRQYQLKIWIEAPDGYSFFQDNSNYHIEDTPIMSANNDAIGLIPESNNCKMELNNFNNKWGYYAVLDAILWKKCDYNSTYDVSKLYEMDIELSGIEESNGSIDSFVLESCKTAPALNQFNRYGKLKEKHNE